MISDLHEEMRATIFKSEILNAMLPRTIFFAIIIFLWHIIEPYGIQLQPYVWFGIFSFFVVISSSFSVFLLFLFCLFVSLSLFLFFSTFSSSLLLSSLYFVTFLYISSQSLHHSSSSFGNLHSLFWHLIKSSLP